MLYEPSSSYSTNEDCLGTLLNIISNAHEGFQTCFFNARSFNTNKRDYFNHILPSTKVDLICVVETWFDKNIDNSMLSLNKYNLVRNDRNTGAKGGGVALYVREQLKHKVVFKSNNLDPVEYIMLEIYDETQKYLVACIYNPSRNNDLKPFFKNFSEISTKYEHVMLCGDINIDLTENDSVSRNLTDSFTGVGMCRINKMPTRYSQHCKPSLLDVFCFGDLDFVNHFEQIALPGISDHDLLFSSYNLKFNTPSTKSVFTYRDFKRLNLQALFSEATILPWNDCRFFSDINKKLEHFTNLINYLFEKYVPLKTIKPRKSDHPWFNDEVDEAIRNRGKLYNRWRRNRSNHNWSQYLVARKHASMLTNAAKCNYYKSKLDPDLPPKNLWSNLKSVGIGNKKSLNCSADANSLNQHFLSSSSTINTSSFKVNEDLLYNLSYKFNFEMCTENDVLVCLSTIKSNAVGEDGVGLKFVRIILPFIIGPLTHIINFSLTTCTFPHLWKIANVIPVQKKKEPSVPEDYRPISLLPLFSKVYERLLAGQIIRHLEMHKLLTENQSGFRAKHSCATAMLKIIDDIREKYDRGEISILVLLDFSKAFDSLDFNLLLIKLEKYFGFGKYAIELMKSYLFDRYQRVKTKEQSSTLERINSGVPQGSILGPILFAIFINDIVHCCKDVSIHLYADDAQVYLSRPLGLIEDLVYRINEDLERILIWANDNNLKLNASKTKALPISHSLFDIESLPAVSLKNVSVNYEHCVTSLGFKINRRLDCSDHINSAVLKMYATLRSLWVSSNFIPENTKIKLIKTLLVPIMSYGAQVYGCIDCSSKQKLQYVINNAARYAFNKRKFDRISTYSIQILNCDIYNYFKKINLYFMFKLIHSKVPDYLFRKLKFVQSTRTFNLVIPKHKYLTTSRTFFISAVKCWNSLPITTKKSRNLALFKLNVDKTVL